MSECNCIIRGDHNDPCNEESDDGNLCGKPTGHDGAHAACSVATHPVEVWDDDG